MPPRTPSDREDDRSDERVDRDASRALRRDEPDRRERGDEESKVHDEARSARHDRDDEPEHAETAADRLAAEVEPKTDAVGAVEALVKNAVDEMRTAPDAHELGEHFSGEARRLAEAALANTDHLSALGATPNTLGFSPAAIANGDQVPHNQAAVESAVAHGMDRDQAHAMTTHGSNS